MFCTTLSAHQRTRLGHGPARWGRHIDPDPILRSTKRLRLSSRPTAEGQRIRTLGRRPERFLENANHVLGELVRRDINLVKAVERGLRLRHRVAQGAGKLREGFTVVAVRRVSLEVWAGQGRGHDG